MKPSLDSSAPSPQSQPVIVLVRPQMGENIGAAARAMLNFGLTRMRLVAPRDGWPNPRAIAMAAGAEGSVLDHAQVFPSLAEALFDIDYAYATTARGRELDKPVLTPAQVMTDARPRLATGSGVALIFGPERAGLENDDIARANAIMTVPVNPQFASLNLGQAVLLAGYEWSRDRLPAQPAPHGRRPPSETPATVIEVEALARAWECQLDDSGFFFPATKAAAMKLTLRNMWSRLPLTQADTKIFHGILRQLLRRD